MLFGLDGVEIGLIITFICLFGGIMSGFPVAFAIGGSAVISFGILVLLAESGILVREVIDTSSAAYQQLRADGVQAFDISHFKYPDLPQVIVPLFQGGWEQAITKNLSFIVNRMNERVFAGPSIETLLAVAMFVLMGITLERSRIANDLLTTMARVFGPLPGGLAVSVVVVGAFLAASTGIVGATVVTMGLLSLPTMLRNGYSPELSTGVIAASGTLGQIIPPSIVIVLLGTLAGDIYATAQEDRASDVGCSDALTLLGEPAVLSVGTLFQAALLPGIFLALLYGLYAFGYALLNPSKAPPIPSLATEKLNTRQQNLMWFGVFPAASIIIVSTLFSAGIAGSQVVLNSDEAIDSNRPELRTNVSEQCREAMIDLHGIEKWERSEARAAEIAAAAASDDQAVEMTAEERRAMDIDSVPPLSGSLLTMLIFFAIATLFARGVATREDPRPLYMAAVGIICSLFVDYFLVGPLTSPGMMFVLQAIPFLLIAYGMRSAFAWLARNELVRVVFPPLVLIVAVLGSILGGITNPTPAAALGAAGAIMLAAYRRLQTNSPAYAPIILWSSFAIVIFLLLGVNFDLRTGVSEISVSNWIAIVVALVAYHVAMGGFLYACWVLFSNNILSPVVRETAKVTSMVFAILIGSQMLNLVIISFGGEHYIQAFLRSFENEYTVFLLVMLVLFVLGFVLDFLEIIYIVVPIVGPVIYGGELNPAWVTIMIAINLQTSFLTPPFGFALFYLRGVAPPQITTGHIYRGAIPFVVIQVVGLVILYFAPDIVTIVPNLLK
ncbi:MAG: TRAP transporter large permease subunit [Pseudomonadota bacterium]